MGGTVTIRIWIGAVFLAVYERVERAAVNRAEVIQVPVNSPVGRKRYGALAMRGFSKAVVMAFMFVAFEYRECRITSRDC